MKAANDTPNSDPVKIARVLLVEPDDRTAVDFVSALDRLDRQFDVTHCKDASVALEKAQETGAASVDAIVAANKLPDSTGIDLFKNLRRAHVYTMIVVMFDSGQENLAAEALRAGVDHVVVRDEAAGYLKMFPYMLDNAIHHERIVEASMSARFAVIVESDPGSSEYKQAEKKLEDNEAFWWSLLENPFEYVLLVDPNGTIRYVNRLLEGVRLETMIGKQTLYDFVPENEKEMIRESLDAIMAGKSSVHYESFVPMVNRWYSCILGPIHKDGRIIGASLFVRDITKQKKTEQLLVESEKWFRQMSENVRDVFYLLDPANMKVLYVNPAYEEIYGRPCQAIYEKALSWMDTVHKDDIGRVREDFEKMIQEKGDVFQGNPHRILRPDGGIRWVGHRSFAVRDSDGELKYRAGIIADITELKQAEDELRKAHGELEQRVMERTRELEAATRAFERARHLASIGTLAAGIAHELNNPLGSIVMAVDNALYLLDEPDGQQSAKEALSDAKENAKRASRIVGSVLDLSRRGQSPRVPCDLCDVIRRARDIVMREVEDAGVTIELDVSRKVQQIPASPHDIEQVFVNLLKNAVEASERGQQVTALVEQKEDIIQVKLIDSGRGMTQEEARNIFDPFYTTRQTEGGTGLGLSLVHAIVYRYGGSIDVDSTPGKGTTITVTFLNR